MVDHDGLVQLRYLAWNIPMKLLEVFCMLKYSIQIFLQIKQQLHSYNNNFCLKHITSVEIINIQWNIACKRYVSIYLFVCICCIWLRLCGKKTTHIITFASLTLWMFPQFCHHFPHNTLRGYDTKPTLRNSLKYSHLCQWRRTVCKMVCQCAVTLVIKALSFKSSGAATSTAFSTLQTCITVPVLYEVLIA